MKDKILVIDDEEIIRRDLKTFLNSAGYEVFTAEDEQQGLNIFNKIKNDQQDPIKIVLVDISMPVMDGFEVTERIKNNTAQTEVIIITEHRGIESAIQALRTGAFDYISKPIEQDDLLLIISRALDRYKMKRKYDKALKLFNITKEFHSTLNLDEVYQIVLDAISKIVGGNNCSIFVKNVESNKLELAASRGKKSKNSPIVSFPLVVDREKIGEIHINNPSPPNNILIEENREILSLLAKHTAVAITGAKLKYISLENKRIKQDLEKANVKLRKEINELSILNELSKEISYTINYEQLVELVMDSLYKVVTYHVCASLVVDEEEATLIIRVVYPVSASFIQEVKSKILYCAVALFGRTFSEEKLTVIMEGSMKAESESEGKVGSFFNVPLVFGDKLVGMIILSSLTENFFSDTDIRLIYTLVNQASSAIERLKVAINAEKSNLKAMVEGMNEGVIMTDNQGNLLVINPAAKNMLAFNPDFEVTRKQLTQCFEAAEEDNIFTRGESYSEEKVFSEMQIDMPSPRILSITQTLVKSQSGEKIGHCIILRDITEEKEVDRMKSEFIATVSHELKTPLAITREGISLVLDNIPGKINIKQDKILSIAKDNIDRLARIINGLLDISKIESGQVALKTDKIEITNLIRQVAFSFENRIKKKDLEIKMNLPEEGLEVIGAGDSIIEIFTNLIGNALKFTEKGYIEISAKELEDKTEYIVSDTGIGISQDNLSKLFGKFQQFGRIDSAGEKGTGLGLSIVKGLIEAHHGEVRAESTPGIGTKIIFTLPKYTKKALLFHEYINSGINEAKKINSKMSLIAVSIFGINSLKQTISSKIWDSTLKELEKILRNSVYRAADIVVREDKEIIILLSNCNKINVRIIETRLKNILDDYLKQQNLTKKIDFQTGFSTYPDDGLSSRILLKTAAKGG